MPQDESANEFHDPTTAEGTTNEANGGNEADADVATPSVALPLGTAPLVGASFGAAGAFSPATAGNALLAGAALPLVAPLLADGTVDRQTPGDDASPPAGSGGAAAASDGALVERVEVALADDGRIARSHAITVVARGGVVELGGTAESAHDRALAEAIAARLPGVAAVRNQVRVAAASGG
jgi:hypothetical protein